MAYKLNIIFGLFIYLFIINNPNTSKSLIIKASIKIIKRILFTMVTIRHTPTIAATIVRTLLNIIS